MTPLFLVGGLILGTTKNTINYDIADVWRGDGGSLGGRCTSVRQGRAKLLLVRGLDVSYGSVQVLFDVDMEIDEGTCVALLGTNGAGKSTLLKAISGVVEADRGAVIFDGREITHAPPNEIAAFGIRQVPGGQGVFLNLTVDENLRCASWLHRHDKDGDRGGHRARARRCSRCSPSASTIPAGDLSGGQQQMLALGMAFLSKPRLLMIDELSLGLAPVVVAQLLPLIDAAPRGGHDDHPRRAVGEPRADTSPTPRTSWSVARSGSTGRRPSSSTGPTCCGRCSSRVRASELGGHAATAGRRRRRRRAEATP